MIPFDVATFPDLLEVGFSGGPRFEVIPLLYRNGREVRTASKRDPSHAYNVSPLMRTQEMFRAAIDFWIARGGSARAFRFRDWHDCSTSKTDDITVPSSISDSCGILVDIGSDQYELWKEYEDDDGYIYLRRIRKPRSNGFRVFNGSTEYTTYFNERTDFSLTVSGTFAGFNSSALTDNFVSATPTNAQMWATNVNTGNRWVTVDFTSTRTIRKFRWYPRATGGSDTQLQSYGWDLLGSNDSSFATFETLYSAPSTYVAGWNEVLVNPTQAYRYYRVRKTTDSGHAVRGYLTFVEIEFYDIQNYWSLDDETGIVTVDPLLAAVDGWIGEFDVPIRFSPDTDDLTSVALQDYEHGKANLILEEVLIGAVPVWEEPVEEGPDVYDTPTSVSNPTPGDGPPTDGGSDGGDGGETGGNPGTPEDNEPPPPPETCEEALDLLPEEITMRRVSDDYTQTFGKGGSGYLDGLSWYVNCDVVEGEITWEFNNYGMFGSAFGYRTGITPYGAVELLLPGQDPGEGEDWICEEA